MAQNNAYQLTKAVNEITVTEPSGGVILPEGVEGMFIKIKNNSSSATRIFPTSLGEIDDLGADTYFSLEAGKVEIFNCYLPNKWFRQRTPGGLDTEVQYNDAGVFRGDAKFTWDKGSSLLTVTGDSIVTGRMAIGATATIDTKALIRASESQTATGLFHFGRGMFITPTLYTEYNTALLRGIEVIATMTGDALDGTLQAIRALATYGNIGDGATVNTISAKISSSSGASAPTDPAVIIIESPTFTGTKPTNNHGLHIQNQGVAGITTSYGLKIEDQTLSGTKYAIKTGLGLVKFGDQILDSNGNEIPPTNFAGITFDKNAAALVIGLVDSFYLIKDWDADMPELVSDGDFSSNDITVGATGKYRINLKIDGESAAANKTFQWYVFEITSTTKAITGATAANPVVITTATLHGFLAGDKIAPKTVGGMIELNDRIFTVLSTPSATTLSIGDDKGVGINGLGFTPYTSGGTLQLATETILHIHRKFNAGGAVDIGDMSDSGIVPLTFNNTLELYIKGTADTTNFLHEHANLSLNRLN